MLYNQERLDFSYIPDLKASFRAFNAARSSNAASSSISPPDDPLLILEKLLFKSNMESVTPLERYSKLITASYNIRVTKTSEETLNSLPSATSSSKNLWWNICLLARFRVAFENFKEICSTIPSFEHLEIILVRPRCTIVTPSQKTLNLEETLNLLGLDLNSSTIAATLGKSRTITRTKRDFVKRQKDRLNVHAEIQMLTFLGSQETPISELFPYLGCSKLSCFMCDRFIQHYGHFHTKGCHGRLFKPWTVPQVNEVTYEQVERISKALVSVKNEVEKTIKSYAEFHIKHERTSAIGGTSLLDSSQEGISQRRSKV